MTAAANLLAVFLLATSPGEETARPTSTAGQQNRPPHELRKAVHDALKRSAPASDPDPVLVAPELVALYKELRVDTQVEQFYRLRLLGLLRTRLEATLKQLEKRETLPHHRRLQTAVPEVINAPLPVLAQQGLPVGNLPGAAGANPGNRGVPPGGLPDNGQMLVDLIKRTIAPSTWDDVGGPGTIYYYRPLRVLVVRQTGEVHEQLGGILGGLRK